MKRSRRTGPVVAVLGPDGAGKGTVIEGIRSRSERPVLVLYLGRRDKPDAAGQRGRAATSSAPGGETPASPARRLLRASPRSLREAAFLIARAIRHLRLLRRGYAAARRGQVVICDRHPIEVLAIVPRRTRIGAWLERLIAGRLIPWPDAVIVLEAPADRLFERKGEHSIETLDRWSRAYREVFGARGATVVSTNGPPEVSVGQALEVVERATRVRLDFAASPDTA